MLPFIYIELGTLSFVISSHVAALGWLEIVVVAVVRADMVEGVKTYTVVDYPSGVLSFLALYCYHVRLVDHRVDLDHHDIL